MAQERPLPTSHIVCVCVCSSTYLVPSTSEPGFFLHSYLPTHSQETMRSSKDWSTYGMLWEIALSQHGFLMGRENGLAIYNPFWLPFMQPAHSSHEELLLSPNPLFSANTPHPHPAQALTCTSCKRLPFAHLLITRHCYLVCMKIICFLHLFDHVPSLCILLTC